MRTTSVHPTLPSQVSPGDRFYFVPGEPVKMRALTVLQPWASAIIRPPGQPFKSVENRCWFTSYRGPLVIHAGRSRERVTPELVALIDRLLPGWAANHTSVSMEAFDKPGTYRQIVLRYGAILGIIDLVDCINADSPAGRELSTSNPWCDPPRDGIDGYYWVLANPRPLAEPIAYSGKQGLWNVTERRIIEKLLAC